MSQPVIELETSLGYLLKEASSALRLAMEQVLRPLDMTITHYSCLELLAQQLVTRSASAPSGRALPTELTARGREQLAAASAAVKEVEDVMLSGLTDAAREQLRAHLLSCVGSRGGVAGEAALTETV